ncbi:hypothetical protein B0H11DRAFT_1973750 [Mycena galericulata]|nr:hypothetical protein B0H11DRAFT_1973750 [Mycena galericulata]
MFELSLAQHAYAGAKIRPARTHVIQNWPRTLHANLQCGVFGRTVHEPITSLTARLADPEGNVLVLGIDGMVSIANKEEHALYSKLHQYHSIGTPIALSASKTLQTHVIMGSTHLALLDRDPPLIFGAS